VLFLSNSYSPAGLDLRAQLREFDGELDGWQASSHLIEDPDARIDPRPGWLWEYRSLPTQSSLKIVVPFWLPVLATGATGAAACVPWIRWRFSLRTLLIATTLVAVALGVVVISR
jgi:hypothetical protein